MHNGQSSSATSKSLQSRQSSSQALKVSALYQGRLSPRSSSFKEGLTRNLSSLRRTARDKLRRCGDNLPLVESLTIASPVTNDSSNSDQAENEDLPDGKSFFTATFLESHGKLSVPPAPSDVSQVSSLGPSIFSPYYCWFPPGSPSLQHSAASELPASSIGSFKLPPLSSMLPMNVSSILSKPTAPLDLANVPSFSFPSSFPEPLVRFPLASSQQIPSFTPLICDPIVHIPVIEVCPSGQGYLVSAGPTISTTIPPLHPNLVNPLLPDTTDSLVEKSARETLRLLISGSTQSHPPLIDVFPTVLTNPDEKKGILVTGLEAGDCTPELETLATWLTALPPLLGLHFLPAPWQITLQDNVAAAMTILIQRSRWEVLAQTNLVRTVMAVLLHFRTQKCNEMEYKIGDAIVSPVELSFVGYK